MAPDVEPFVLTLIPAYIETGFTRRAEKLRQAALSHREIVVGLALPGDGKTAFYREVMRQCPVWKDLSGYTRTKALGARIPVEGLSSEALAYALGERFSLHVPSRRRYPGMLNRWARNGLVELVMIDNGHYLAPGPRGWLLGFVEALADPQDPRVTPLRVGLLFLANATPDGKASGRLFSRSARRDRVDLPWWEFVRRGDFDFPVERLDGLDVDETQEALAGLELLYRPQFAAIDLQSSTDALFEKLLDRRIDVCAVGRARMDSVVKCVHMALSREAEAGGAGRGLRERLLVAAERLAARPDDMLRFRMPERPEP